jgi:hypothetical protein
VHLILANLPGVSYESAPRRFRETRSTILNWQDSVIERLPRTVPNSTAAPNRIFDGMDRVLTSSDNQNAIRLPVAAPGLRRPPFAMVDFPPVLVRNGLAENTRTNVPSRP